MGWDSPNPVFLDFETQSACDLKESGGRLYASHPSTRILSLAACVDNVYHVWIPDHIRTQSPNVERLWPYQLQPKREVILYRGSSFPAPIVDSIKTRPVVAHNAYGFDRFIWERFHDTRPEWLDSLFLARQSGRTGRLDQLGQSILGEGKNRAKKLTPLLTTAKAGVFADSWSYPVIKPGDLQAYTTYNIADVEIMRQLWDSFSDLEVEADVIEVHNRINDRGVYVDKELLKVIERLSEYSTTQAANDIADMTDGRLHAGNLRSTKQVHEWLASYGISITDHNGKPCLRKEVVQKTIDSPWIIDVGLSAAREIPPLVIEVLRLRLKALRITSAKVTRALARAGVDSRIRDLHSYSQAHTRRWSSSGVQIHNLPRPRREIDIKATIDLIESNQTNDIAKLYDAIKAALPAPDEGQTKITVDDVCSALIRPCITAKPGYVLIPCDFSTVEARGAALIADERKLLTAFREGRDIYKEFAVSLYKVEYTAVTDLMRQVCKVILLGCQYGLGPDKFRVYAASNGVDLVKAGVTADECIQLYRDTYTNIAGFRPDAMKSFRTNGIWHKLDKAVKDCVATGQTKEAGRCVFTMENKSLVCVLPSGGRIYYPDARIEDIVPPYCYTMGLPLVPKSTVVYTSPHGPKSVYGGLLTENVVQAICRDLLAYAILRCEESGLNVVLHVHDEIVIEVEEANAERALRIIVEIMSDPPEWLADFPLACEAFVTPRFTKKAFKGWKKLETKEIRQREIA
jgi:DNA polymerase